jgi:hypothetical protein
MVRDTRVLSVPLPIKCSSCYGQRSERKHWDFDAICDRGYAPVDEGDFNADGDRITAPVRIENLILCDECLKEGARAMGWVAQDDKLVQTLQKELVIERKARRQAQNYADRLEAAFEARSKPITLDHRQKPRKGLVTA